VLVISFIQLMKIVVKMQEPNGLTMRYISLL
jgi:hypothetical protein